jgi:hypothetical protein
MYGNHRIFMTEVRVAALVVIICFLFPLYAFGQQSCAQAAKVDKSVLRQRAPYVVSVAKKIVSRVPFTRSETDIMPIHDVEELALDGYNFGFVASLYPKENLKVSFLKKAQKTVDDVTRDLSPNEAKFTNPWASKIIAVQSKAFDAGFADGGEPCPKDKR